MPAGADWFQEITEQLHKAGATVLCFTPDNLKSQWMHFEAGAIAATAAREKKPVCPYLASGVQMNELGPLSTRYAVRSDEGGTRRLVERLNSQLDSAKQLRGDVLRNNFGSHWPNLKTELDKVNNAFPLEFRVEAREQPTAPTYKRKVFFFIKNVSDVPVVLTDVHFTPHRQGPRLAASFSRSLETGELPKFYDKAKKLHESPTVIVHPQETTHVYVAYENSSPIISLEKAVRSNEIGTLKLDLWTKGRTITYQH